MLAMLEARLEKNLAARRKVACSRAPCRSQYDVHSMQVVEATTQSRNPRRSIHTQRDASRNFRTSQADGSASVLLAATLALAASGVPAGCGFQSAGTSAVATNTSLI